MLRLIFLLLTALLVGCASTQPDGFVYKTSLRGEQGLMGASARDAAARALLATGVVTNPSTDLERLLPEAQIEMRQWGLQYFGSDWERYQAVLHADVIVDARKVRCRMVSPDTRTNRPTLDEMTADGGALLQSHMQDMVQRCAAQTRREASPD